jgi:hypothetical protein
VLWLDRWWRVTLITSGSGLIYCDVWEQRVKEREREGQSAGGLGEGGTATRPVQSAVQCRQVAGF